MKSSPSCARWRSGFRVDSTFAGTNDPFLIQGPAYIGFSGGRSSGMLVGRTREAYDGKLPTDILSIFGNTGKEAEETLEFVQELSERWSIPTVWVEYKRGVVDFKTASRKGEPYSQLIEDRGRFLPNPVMRFCTVELKLKPTHDYLRGLGWDEWLNCVGFRADEPARVAKLSNPRKETPEETRIAPLARSRVTKRDVAAYWQDQDFDLRLKGDGGDGNCDLCFLKSADQILSLIRAKPARAVWWMQQEDKTGGTFRSDRPNYTAMHRMATNHGELFPFGDEPLEDCACTD